MKKQAYLIGIKGVGMTALAVYLHEKGCQVSGSDVDDIFPTDEILKAKKIEIVKGFYKENISSKFDFIVATGAHGGKTNVEALEAVKIGIPVFMHGEYLGKIMSGKFGISVAGCHGKTTTSSIISFLLKKGGHDPSYAIGTASINNLGPAGHFGRGNYFIAEADEYMTCPNTDRTPRFLYQKPKILVLTNIEYDHPDAYADLNAVKEAFLKLINELDKDSLIIACIDNKNISDVLKQVSLPVITYGFSPKADYQISKSYFGERLSFMRLKHKYIDIDEFMLQIPGKHNQLNALAASIAVNHIGMQWDKIKDIIKKYSGCRRRFEKITEVNDIYYYDDYAHHPSEIISTLKAAREWFGNRRIIVVFQPHTFSRTKKLINDFAKSFLETDKAVITDIYSSAREVADSSVNSRILTDLINNNKNNALYLKNKPMVLSYLQTILKPGDLLMTMGAGDIYNWVPDIIEMLNNNNYD